MNLVSFATFLLYLSSAQSDLVQSTALESAEQLTRSIAEFRALYTTEVVSSLQGTEVPVVHDYESRPGAIPLPATLSLKLGERLGTHADGARFRLYSPYPFPLRVESGGLQDSFARDAWDSFQQEPETPFFRFENTGGERYLRYATADRLLEACVDCHNTHPESPRRDWKEGDVRGVLEVRLPLREATLQASRSLGGVILLGVGCFLLVILSMAIVLRLMRRDSAILLAAEERLRQSQKMESVGRLAAGVAHDFNNMLSVIMGYAEMTLDKTEPGHPSRKALEAIHEAGEQSSVLAGQLLAFGRKQVLDPRVVDLNELLPAIRNLLRMVVGEHIELRLKPGESLGRVKVDPNLTEQAIVNLAINAKDAMPSGGALTIETSNVHLDEEYARTHPKIEPGEYVMIAVSDTGVGMDQETLSRVFEPFFTTKAAGKGTGLGLASVHGFVTQSGGLVWAYSEPGQGTTFKLYLPRVTEELDAETKRRFRKPPPGSETGEVTPLSRYRSDRSGSPVAPGSARR